MNDIFARLNSSLKVDNGDGEDNSVCE